MLFAVAVGCSCRLARSHSPKHKASSCARLPLPSPPLHLRCKGGSRLRALVECPGCSCAPSLVHSTGEGWGGVLLAMKVGCAFRSARSHSPKHKASSCARLPLPSPPLHLRCMGGGRLRALVERPGCSCAPSLVRSTGEGWGGVLLVMAAGCSCRLARSHSPKHKASSCARLPLPSPPLHLRCKGGGRLPAHRDLRGTRLGSPNEQRPGIAGALSINTSR